MTFLGQGSMANPCVLGAVLPFQHSLGRIEYPMTIRVIDDIVEILEILFSYEIAKNINITIGFRIGGKDIVIGNNHYLAGIPDLGVCTKFPLKDPNGARAANIMSHEHIRSDPYIISSLHTAFASGSRKNFFSERHILRIPECQVHCSNRPLSRAGLRWLDWRVCNILTK